LPPLLRYMQASAFLLGTAARFATMTLLRNSMSSTRAAARFVDRRAFGTARRFCQRRQPRSKPRRGSSHRCASHARKSNLC
jgi:hypothetical protein